MTLHRWLGPSLLTQLSDLKPVQIKELTESFEAADKESKGQGTGHQQRYTKAQQREREAASLAAAVDDAPPEGIPPLSSIAGFS
jgi:cytoskeleton-associated protein 5